jgi:hypothetical protein
MNIVATAVEPEFLSLKPMSGGGALLTIDIAHFQVTEIHKTASGSLQVVLMRSDFENIARTCKAAFPEPTDEQ